MEKGLSVSLRSKCGRESENPGRNVIFPGGLYLCENEKSHSDACKN